MHYRGRAMNASARFAISLLVTLVPFASACSDSSSGPGGSRHLSAQIRRTEYGIPHVTASDWESLAFGYGYAYSPVSYTHLTLPTNREV